MSLPDSLTVGVLAVGLVAWLCRKKDRRTKRQRVLDFINKER